MLRRPLSLMLAFGLIAVVAQPAMAQTTLRYKYKEGEVLPFRVDQNTKMAVSILGMDIDMTMMMGMDVTWTIKSVSAAGKAEVMFKFGKAKMTLDTPMGKVNVSSEDTNEPDDELGQAFAKMVKGVAKLEMSGTIDAQGDISDVKVPDKVVKELKRIAGATGPLGGMVNADSLKALATGGSMGLVLPKEAVAKGKSWNHKTTTNTELGKAKVDMKYTYEGAKNGLEVISLKPTIDIKPKEDAPIAIKIKSIQTKGQALFDNEAGRLRELTTTQVLEIEAEAMGQTFQQKMTVETKMKQIKAK